MERDRKSGRQRHRAKPRGRAAVLAGAFALSAAIVGAASAATAIPATPTAREPLRICADPDNLPFSSDRAGTPGLSLEIAQLIADALGRPLEPVWAVTVFGKRSLRTTLLAGQCDAFVGLPETTDFMGKRLIFSQPLFTMGYALALPVGETPRGLADLDGKRVGVQFSTTPQSLLATRPAVTSVTFMDPDAAMAALGRGELDAAFVWGPTAGYVNQTALADRFHIVPVAGTDLQWPVGIGFARGHDALRDEVDHVLGGLGAPIGRIAQKYGMPTEAPMRLATAPTPPPTGARIILAAATTEDAAPAPTSTQTQLAMARPLQFDPDWVNIDVVQGREIFNTTCAHCHGPNAEQAMPRINLRLMEHRYGEKMDEVFVHVVTHGRTSRGMPNWSGVLADVDLVKIGAFLHTVQQEK
jgi:ABC-type amino acid transport substrate-binding protein/cytochrome c5